MTREDIKKEIKAQKKKVEQTTQIMDHFKGSDLDDSQAQLLQSSIEQYQKEIVSLEKKLNSLSVGSRLTKEGPVVEVKRHQIVEELSKDLDTMQLAHQDRRVD